MARRPSGSGSIWFTDPHWIAGIALRGGKQARRKCRSREGAEEALVELMDAHADELGYWYYAMPRPVRFGEAPAHPRAGMSSRLRFAILRRDGFRCRYCGATAQDARLVVDHVQPIADGGTNDTHNLVTACGPCNAGKASVTLSASEVASLVVA